MKPDYYAILGVPKSADAATIRSAYRRLAKQHHPDHHGDPDKFRAINEAHDVLGDADKRALYDRHGTTKPACIRSKAHAYEVGALLCSGDLADLLAATNELATPVVLKGCRDPGNNDLLANEAAALTALGSGPGCTRVLSDADRFYLRYLPELHDSFAVRDSARTNRQVNVLEHLDGWHALDTVRRRARAGVQWKHGVWMFNRLLEILGYVHRQRLVHGALVPPHVMVYSSGAQPSEWDHAAKLVDWSYSCAIGSRVTAIAPTWRDHYAPEVLAKRPATPETDIYMAAKAIVYVLGGDARAMTLPPTVPNYLTSFLRGCVQGNPAARPGDAWELRAEFEQHMLRNFGPKQYIPFTMPNQTERK